jgi:hypothetical protein
LHNKTTIDSEAFFECCLVVFVNISIDGGAFRPGEVRASPKLENERLEKVELRLFLKNSH